SYKSFCSSFHVIFSFFSSSCALITTSKIFSTPASYFSFRQHKIRSGRVADCVGTVSEVILLIVRTNALWEEDVFKSDILFAQFSRFSKPIDLLLHSTTTATASIGMNFRS